MNFWSLRFKKNVCDCILHHQVLYHRKTVVYHLVQLQSSRSYELRISYPSTVSYCFRVHIVFEYPGSLWAVASCQIVFINRLLTSFWHLFEKVLWEAKLLIGWLQLWSLTTPSPVLSLPLLCNIALCDRESARTGQLY